MNHQQNRNHQRKQHKNDGPMLNENITSASFVLIDENGNNLGQVTKANALEMASKKQLDVVVISSPNASPVIAKLMDYGRYLYEQKRKKRESKKKQTVIRVKEINVKPTIGQHDLT